MTRTVSLADDAYELLRKAKRPGESFSDLTRRLLSRDQSGILALAGTWADVTDAEAEAMKAEIRRLRDEGRGGP